MLLLIAIACSSPEPQTPAAPAQTPVEVMDPTPEPAEKPATSAEEEAADAARAKAIHNHCLHLEHCGCSEGQGLEQCKGAASMTTLPASVYECTSAIPCKELCAVGVSGTADKGTTACVVPYIQSQVPGGPSQGPALKGRRSTKKAVE